VEIGVVVSRGFEFDSLGSLGLLSLKEKSIVDEAVYFIIEEMCNHTRNTESVPVTEAVYP